MDSFSDLANTRTACSLIPGLGVLNDIGTNLVNRSTINS